MFIISIMGMIPPQQDIDERIFPKIENNPKLSFSELKSDLLVSFSESCSEGAVGMVDIVNSTQIAAKIGNSRLAMYYGVFLNSMGAIIQKHGGKVVKNIGDSVLFYFCKPQSSTEFTRPLECALAMISAHDIINKVLSANHLPPLNYRVSLDHGPIVLARTSTSSCEDIFGPPVNMCAKINSLAKPNAVAIGGDMYQIVKHLNYCFEEVKGYSVGFKYKYPVYFLSHNNANNASLITAAIEKTLTEIGTPALEVVIAGLFNNYKCFLSDCYEHPEYLKQTLHDIYGSSHTAIIKSIISKLEPHAYKKPMYDFIESLRI